MARQVRSYDFSLFFLPTLPWTWRTSGTWRCSGKRSGGRHGGPTSGSGIRSGGPAGEVPDPYYAARGGFGRLSSGWWSWLRGASAELKGGQGAGWPDRTGGADGGGGGARTMELPPGVAEGVARPWALPCPLHGSGEGLARGRGLVHRALRVGPIAGAALPEVEAPRSPPPSLMEEAGGAVGARKGGGGGPAGRGDRIPAGLGTRGGEDSGGGVVAGGRGGGWRRALPPPMLESRTGGARWPMLHSTCPGGGVGPRGDNHRPLPVGPPFPPPGGSSGRDARLEPFSPGRRPGSLSGGRGGCGDRGVLRDGPEEWLSPCGRGEGGVLLLGDLWREMCFVNRYRRRPALVDSRSTGAREVDYGHDGALRPRLPGGTWRDYGPPSAHWTR